MSTTLTDLHQWMAAPSETEHLEFKEAVNQFDFNKLLRYRKGTIKEFEEALPSLTRYQIHSLLKELKKDGRIVHFGSKKGGYWEQNRE